MHVDEFNERSQIEYSEQNKAGHSKYEALAVMMIIIGFLLLLVGIPVYAWGSNYGGNPFQIEGLILCIAGFVLLTVGLFFSLEYKTRAKPASHS